MARLLACIALDKFTDYVSDTVVAPVRETAAQALGYAAAPMGRDHLARISAMLAELDDPEDWKVRGKGRVTSNLCNALAVAGTTDVCDELASKDARHDDTEAVSLHSSRIIY